LRVAHALNGRPRGLAGQSVSLKAGATPNNSAQ
jgi:hypothetical protein